MGVALFIVPEREIEGLDHFVNGRFIGHESDKTIDNFCKQVGVKSLYEFCSQDPDELAGFLEDLGGDIPEELPAREFFYAKDGLETVRGMLKALESGDSPFKETEGVIEDLREYEAVLLRLETEGVRWHMQVDF